ncbi:MAG: FG-GAP-like repeat-containing protein [Gemmataceae bacterium]
MNAKRPLPRLLVLEDRTVPNGDPFANLPDADADGLPDAWETAPQDFNGDNVADLNLPALGANPGRKDLFVEVDAMQGRQPLPSVIPAVVRAFANAPVPNPNGQSGIALHVVHDEIIPLRNYPQMDANGFPAGANEDRARFFGTAADRASPNAAQILAAKAFAFRYLIFANSYDVAPNDGSSGIANGLPGNTSIVSLGSFPTPGGTADEQAGTFLHEFGHNLGLRHNGATDTPNNNPNYLSVMSYAYQMNQNNAFTTAAQSPFPDFTRNANFFFDWGAIVYNPRLINSGAGGGAFREEDPDTFTPESGAATLAVGADSGGPVVVAYDHNGKENFRKTVYESTFTGGVRVAATGDVDGDGVPDVVTVPGPGRPLTFHALRGTDGKDVKSFDAFEASFTGGGFVTTADLNGDGYAEVIVSPDVGGGPRVRVFSGADGSVLADFFGIDDPAFRGGCRVGTGDVNGDGRADLIVSAGFGGGPRLALFDGAALATGTVSRLVADFFAFEDTLRNGAFVTGGDVSGDGFCDLVIGAGPGGGPRVRVVDGKAVMAQGTTAALQNQIADFFAGDTSSRAGVRVGVTNRRNDGVMDTVVSGGFGAGPRVNIYPAGGLPGTPSATPPTTVDPFDPTSSFGVFVG